MRLCSAAIVMYTHSRIYILSACCSCVRASVCVCLLSSVLRLMRKISNSPKAKQQKMQFTHTLTHTHTIGHADNSNSSIACGLCGQ